MERRISGLQGLRAVAFIAIFISHTSIGNFVLLGAWGVSVFLILSGFVMILSYLNKKESISLTPRSVIGFAWNKIKKLYPLHIVMMLSCILIALYYVFIIHTMTIKKLIVDVFLHTFLLQIWIPNSEYYQTLNGVSWYLCVCVLLYLVFPFVLKFFRWYDKRHEVRHAFVILIMLVGVQVVISFIAYRYGGRNWNDLWSMQWITYYCPLSRLFDFLIGCTVGYLYLKRDRICSNFYRKNPESNVSKLRSYASAHKTVFINIASTVNILSICYLLFVVSWGAGYEWLNYTLIYTPTTIVTILLACSKSGFISKILSSNVLVLIGNMSGWGFLIHKAVIKYCEFILNYIGINNVLIIAAVSAMLTAVAIYFWNAIDGKLRKGSR